MFKAQIHHPNNFVSRSIEEREATQKVEAKVFTPAWKRALFSLSLCRGILGICTQWRNLLRWLSLTQLEELAVESNILAHPR
jgi:hypothetical protein